MVSINIEKQVSAFCARIGADPLLVQGAGGNASWKENSTLWIKASGAWLANAENEEIFIPVNLAGLKSAIANHNFSVAPEVLSDVKAKPSIETMLHAVMPHRVVLHLHAIEVLVHLIKKDFDRCLSTAFGNLASFAVVEYRKPGADLAAAVNIILRQKPGAEVIFLKNHGIVIGGDNAIDIHRVLSSITESLAIKPMCKEAISSIAPNLPENFSGQYELVADQGVQQLALDPILYKHLNSEWALYPDHVVFLGPKAHVYDSWPALTKEFLRSKFFPELVFIRGEGVFARPSFTKAKLAQLRCYFDVLTRLEPDSSLAVLSNNQIAELLNWDAEQYRINLSN